MKIIFACPISLCWMSVVSHFLYLTENSLVLSAAADGSG
jgi:hypothetical protein